MDRTGRTVSIVSLAAFAATAACGKDPVGTTVFEPAELAATADKVFDTFGTTALTSFRNTGFPPIAALLAQAGPSRIVHDGLVPPTALGKTYTWSLATGAYTESTRPGAPSNGVRFVMYQLQSQQALPVVPLVELATVDFVDQGTPSALSLGVIVQTPSMALADYDLAGTLGASSLVLAGGMVRDDAATPTIVSFDVNASANPGAGTSNSTTELLAADGTRLRHSFNLIGATDQTTLLVERGATSITFDLGTGAASGTISINNVLVANITGASIVPVAGSDLLADDVLALTELRQAIVRVQDANVLLLRPFYHFF